MDSIRESPRWHWFGAFHSIWNHFKRTSVGTDWKHGHCMVSLKWIENETDDTVDVVVVVVFMFPARTIDFVLSHLWHFVQKCAFRNLCWEKRKFNFKNLWIFLENPIALSNYFAQYPRKFWIFQSLHTFVGSCFEAIIYISYRVEHTHSKWLLANELLDFA